MFGEAPLGLEPATLGGCEAMVWQPEAGDLGEHLASALEPLLERHGGCTERRRAASALAHDIERGCHELLALGVALAATGGRDQSQALVDLEAMLHDGACDQLLLLLAERAERIGQGRAELVSVDAVGYRGGEPRCQHQALCHPAFPAAGHGRDRGHADTVSAQRADDPSLVHGRQRARWRIALEHQDLGLVLGRSMLDDDRHLGRTAVAPPLKPLQAIEDLQASVLGADRPDRKLAQPGCMRLPGWHLSRPQRCEAGGQILRRDQQDLGDASGTAHRLRARR